MGPVQADPGGHSSVPRLDHQWPDLHDWRAAGAGRVPWTPGKSQKPRSGTVCRTRRRLEAPIAGRLLHLGLLVRDQRRSLRFYEAYFGFDAARARRYPDGTVIVRNADGFDLALHPGTPPEQFPAFLHFGFQLPGADAVRELFARMQADGVQIEERWDEPSYVAFKCLDPDGWRVEVYWEPIGEAVPTKG